MSWDELFGLYCSVTPVVNTESPPATRPPEGAKGCQSLTVRPSSSLSRVSTSAKGTQETNYLPSFWDFHVPFYWQIILIFPDPGLCLICRLPLLVLYESMKDVLSNTAS